MTRVGELKIREVGDDVFQCGSRGTRRMAYRADLECDVNKLDDRGFIFDQIELDKLIVKRYAVFDESMPSCERICIDACGFLLALCPQVHAVQFSLGQEIGSGGWLTFRRTR